MESSLREITPSGHRNQRSLPSDLGGKQLREKTTDESEHQKLPNTTQQQKFRRSGFTYFGTLNINGLNETGKVKTLTDMMIEQKISILGLQEMRNTCKEPYESQGFRFYQGIPGKRVMRNVPQFGTGFVIRKDIQHAIIDFKPYTERIATLSLKFTNKIYTIINAHAPTNKTNNTDRQSVDKFWDLLDQIMTKIDKFHTKILIGDFNAKLGKEKRYRSVVGKWPAHNKTTENGKRLVNLCKTYELISKSTYFQKKNPGKLRTWKHPDWTKGEHQLDHVCAERETHKEIYNVKVMKGAKIKSDHYLVKIKIKMTPKNSRKTKRKILTKKYDPTKLIGNEEYKKKSKLITHFTKLQVLTEKLKSIAEETAPPNKRKKHAWWNEICEKALEERHKKWMDFNANKTQENHDRFTLQRKLSQKVIRNVKRKHDKDILTQIEADYHKNNMRQYYKNFKNKMSKFTPPTLMLKNKEGKIAHNDKENAQILAETFNYLLNCEEPRNTFDIDTNTEVKTKLESIEPPTIEEIEVTLKELKNNKASGEDQITAEIWKNAPPEVKNILHREIKEMWEKEEIPKEWKMAIIHPLFKNKGDKSNPDNYRGISLLDCTYKIFSRVIYNRIKDQLEEELGDYQGGFRPWRSCPDQILSLKFIIEYFKSRNKQLVITFIDFKKAYDCIHRESLLRILRNFGLHPKLISMIKLTLTDTCSKVKFRTEISEPFKIKTGLRQGDVLSPLLFNCALEYIIRQWEGKNNRGIKIGTGITVNCLGFADDLAFLSNNIEETRVQLEGLEELAGKIGLQISYAKTKIMVREPLCINKVEINGQDIELVKEFRYLGEVITHNLKEKRNWIERQNKLNRSLILTRNIYNKKNLSINTKIRHYKTVVLPEILYGSETLWDPTVRYGGGKLETIERKIIRSCIGKWIIQEGTYRNIPNEEVYQRIEPLVDIIRKRRISFLGHILRMKDTRLLKRLTEFYWKRKTQPKWLKMAIEDMKELNIERKDLEEKSGNYNLLRDDRTRFRREARNRKKMVISEAERKNRSDRMKKYHAELKAKRTANK